MFAYHSGQKVEKDNLIIPFFLMNEDIPAPSLKFTVERSAYVEAHGSNFSIKFRVDRCNRSYKSASEKQIDRQKVNE